MKLTIDTTDETFQMVRWLNLVVGLLNFYYFSLGAGWLLMGIGILNIGVWVMTRKNILGVR